MADNMGYKIIIFFNPLKVVKICDCISKYVSEFEQLKTEFEQLHVERERRKEGRRMN